MDAVTISRLKTENADLQNKTDELKREIEKRMKDFEAEKADLEKVFTTFS